MKQLMYVVVLFACPAIGYSKGDVRTSKAGNTAITVEPAAKLDQNQVRVDLQVGVGRPYYHRRPVYYQPRPVAPPRPSDYYYSTPAPPPPAYYYHAPAPPPPVYYYPAPVPAPVYVEPPHPAYYRPAYPAPGYYHHPGMRGRHMRGR